jgi:hypothetical protein
MSPFIYPPGDARTQLFAEAAYELERFEPVGERDEPRRPVVAAGPSEVWAVVAEVFGVATERKAAAA